MYFGKKGFKCFEIKGKITIFALQISRNEEVFVHIGVYRSVDDWVCSRV